MNQSLLLSEINSISKSKILGSANLDDIINEIGMRVCKCLKLERVNIWLYSAERDFIRAIGEMNDYGKIFSKGNILFEKDIPKYFSHLMSDEIIAIEDVKNNPITSELYENYCSKYNIVSIMDVPLRIEGNMVGVICFEQTVTKRIWTEEEQKFALSAAQIISLAIETKQRRRIQASLERELREKDMLIKESHHRIKNNFAILISLLRLRANTTKNQTAQEILEDCINRIFSIMKVHEQLYKTKGYTIVQLEPYIKELAREIQYNTSNLAIRVKVEIYCDDISIKSTSAVYLGLFVNEILTNCMKYSFDEIKEPQINIEIKEDNAEISFKISDNGKGFDYEKNLTDNTIGLSVLMDLCKSLNGKLLTPTVGNSVYELIYKEKPELPK